MSFHVLLANGLVAVTLLFSSCDSKKPPSDNNKVGANDTAVVVKKDTAVNTTIDKDTVSVKPQKPIEDPEKKPKGTYVNARFKDVTVERLAGDTYRVRGTAQVFEASFGWVLEDGHNEIKKGHEMTDAGAPAWGKFDFTVMAKRQPNATIHLILFESSAKDGSRQHELAIPLP